MLTVVVSCVDQVGVALAQVCQQGSQRCVISGQGGQVEGAAAVPVHEGGVSPSPQQSLQQPHLPGDDGQV